MRKHSNIICRSLLILLFLCVGALDTRAGELTIRPETPQVGGTTALVYKPNAEYPGNPFLVARVYGFTPLSTTPVERSTVLTFERASGDFRGQFYSDMPFVYLLIEFTDGNLTFTNNGEFYEVYMHQRDIVAPYALHTAALSYYGIGELQRRHNIRRADSLANVANAAMPSRVFDAIVQAEMRDSATILIDLLQQSGSLQSEFEFSALLKLSTEHLDPGLTSTLVDQAFERFSNSFALLPFYTQYFDEDQKGEGYVHEYIEIAKSHAERYGKEATEHLFEDVFHHYHSKNDYEQAKELIEEQYVHPHMAIALAKSIASDGDMSMALNIVNSSAGIAQQKIRWFEENINNDIVKYNRIIRDNARLLFVLALLEYEDGLNDDVVLSRIAQGLEMIERDVTEQDYEQVLDVYLGNGKLKDAFSVILAAAKNDMLNDEMYATGEQVFTEINRRRVNEDTTSFATLIERIHEDQRLNEINGAFDRMYRGLSPQLEAKQTDGTRWTPPSDSYSVVVYGGTLAERIVLLDSLSALTKSFESHVQSFWKDRSQFVVWNEAVNAEEVRSNRDQTATDADWVLAQTGSLAREFGMSARPSYFVLTPSGSIVFDELNAPFTAALQVLAREDSK